MIQKPFRGVQLNRTHPLSKGLVGCWLFNEATGETVFDYSNNGNNGTLENGVTWDSDGLDFDGNNDYVNISENSFPTGASPRTITMRFKTTDSTSAHRNMFSYGTASLTNAIYISMPTDTDSNMPVDDSIGISQYGDGVGTTVAVNDGVWHEIVATFNGTTWYVYLDGTLNNSKTITTNTIKSGVASIGSSMAGDGAYYPGSINSVRVYNRALSADEIAWSYREPYAMFEPAFNPALLYSAAPPVGAIWYYNMLRRRNR